MLRGHVFSRQVFGNPIFALFVNTFLNGKNGVSNNYKNGMALTYSGSNVSVDTGAICIQGRFLEEDSGSTIAAGTESLYCKLVIEIDLDKTNTDSNFQQGAYKIITSSSGYPNLTQTEIVKNNAGKYQYELARFRTSANGITDFQDKRTFLDFESIYDEIEQHIQDIDDGSAFVSKNNIAVLTGTLTEGRDTKSFPEGFTKDNCVVLSVMFHRVTESNDVWGVGATFDSSSYNNAAVPARVSMNTEEIIVQVKNINLQNGALPVVASQYPEYSYKLVLMKIS